MYDYLLVAAALGVLGRLLVSVMNFALDLFAIYMGYRVKRWNWKSGCEMIPPEPKKPRSGDTGRAG